MEDDKKVEEKKNGNFRPMKKVKEKRLLLSRINRGRQFAKKAA